MKRKAAFYIRLSDADAGVKKGCKDESNSISAQRELLYSYVRNHEEFADYEISEYFDDGISGTRFESRDSFVRMIDDAKAGLFECLLVKDFSRFGRDYLEVGNYMEFVFPLIGIRFISVNDGYDSEKSVGMTGGMDVAFKNLIYQLYSRDLSRKVKTARRNRNLNGEYTGAFVAYGYRKDPSDYHKLVVDEEEAVIVRRIFEETALGKSGGDIARELNAEHIPTRLQRQWKKSGYVPYHDQGDYLWDSSIINMITRNEAYTGVMIQNKCEVYGFGDNKRIRKRSREEWSVVEGGIPAIISRDLFERAKITCKPGRREQNRGKHKNLFECPYCGRKLRKTRYASKYVCPVRNMDKDRPCGRIMMPVEEAEKALLDTINESCRMLLSEREMADQKVNTEIDPAVRIKELKREQERLESSVVRLYEAYKAGELSRTEYMARRERDKEREAELETEVQNLLNRSSTSKSDDQIETLRQCRDLSVFDPDVIEKVVSRILIYDDKRVEVVFAGDDFYQHMGVAIVQK